MSISPPLTACDSDIGSAQFGRSVEAMAALFGSTQERGGDYENRLQGLHDLLLEKDVLGEEEMMLKCAALREEMSASRPARGATPSFDSLVLERAIRELLIAKGQMTDDQWRQQTR